MTDVAGTSLRPMLATSGDLPVGPDWSYEFKWDGIRAIGSLRGNSLQLWARSGVEITVAYPELAGLSGVLGDATLDGEVVALDAVGRPSFNAVAERMHVREPGRAARLAAALPVTYLIFDLLRLDGMDLMHLPYVQRRGALEALDLRDRHWLVPPRFADGPATVAAAREHSLEGVLAKRASSTYRPGVRSPDWIKYKLEQTEDVVVGGWRPGARRLGALLVGLPMPDGRLRFLGRVGGGISGSSERALLSELEPLHTRTSPFAAALPREDAKDAIWVVPQVVVEVRYAEMTRDGRLRFPRFVALRPDKTVADCRPEGIADGH